jgi:hypothetical protein
MTLGPEPNVAKRFTAVIYYDKKVASNKLSLLQKIQK